MARDPKLEVAAVNIRIPEGHNRNYGALIDTLASLRRGVQVYGDSYVAISFFDRDEGYGVFSKYTEIDIDGEWFDLDDFDTAAPEKLDQIRIPESLRPNLSRFFFKLDEEQHVIVFSSYAESKGLSSRSVLNYFRDAFTWDEISSVFGRVESDVVLSYSAVDEILSLPHLKELRFVLRRPNPDDVGKTLAKIIEDRLKFNNADEYEEVLRSKDSGDLSPTSRTRNLGTVTAENGELHARSVINGVTTDRTTAESPLKESTKYKPDQSEYAVFSGLAAKILGKIASARRKLREQPDD